MSTMDAIKLALGLLNAFAGVIAGTAQDIDPGVRLVCVALVTACGFGLMFMERIGGDQKRRLDPDRLTAAQTRQVADELERRMKAQKP